MSACTLSLPSLKRGENHVTWSLSAAELELDADFVTLDGPLDVDLTMFREGDNIEVRGVVRGRARDVCSRCGGAVTWSIDSEIRLFATPAPEEEGAGEADDDALLVHDGITLELGESIRQMVMLAVPMAPLCDEQCLGLCPSCGKN